MQAESIPQLAQMTKPDSYKFWYNQRWTNFAGTTVQEAVGWVWQKLNDPFQVDEKLKSQEKLKAVKKEVAEYAERIKSLLDSTAEGIWGEAVEGKITFVNQAAVKLFGYDSAEEIIGQNSHQLAHHKKADGSPYLQIECPTYESFQNGTTVHSENKVLWRKDGTSFYANYRSTPVIRDNKLVGAVTTFLDITEHRQNQVDLKNAKEGAEHANKLKSEFLANMNHEIRTPLGVIMGFADLIVDPETTAEDKLQFASVLRQNGQQLSVIINDILDLPKVEAGHPNIDIETFSIVNVIREVFSAFEINAKEKRLKLNLITSSDLIRNVNSDRVRVSQVIWNLLGNAIKFTDNGSVTVFVSHQNSQIEIAIQDTGIGISEQQRDKLFKPFSQADGSITRKYGGTGLGLTLSKKLAQLLGGDLTLTESTHGQGSRFSFTFNPHLHTTASIPKFDLLSPDVLLNPTENGLQGINILVVEDSPDNQTLIVHLLEKKELPSS